MKYVNVVARCLGSLLAGSCMLAGAAPLAAAPMTVVNASFEELAIADGAYVEGRFGSGWKSFNVSNGTQNPTAAAFPAGTHGNNTAYLNTFIGPEKNGFIYQTVANSVAASTRYTLSVDVGWRADALAMADFAVELVGGDPLRERMLFASGSFATSEFSKGEFRTLTFSWDSDEALATPLSILLRGFYRGGQGGEYRQVNFDNVRLDATPLAPVPEPATWAMMITGFGLAGSALRHGPVGRRMRGLAV